MKKKTNTLIDKFKKFDIFVNIMVLWLIHLVECFTQSTYLSLIYEICCFSVHYVVKLDDSMLRQKQSLFDKPLLFKITYQINHNDFTFEYLT